MPKTAVIQISNTDNRLSQREWFEFITALRNGVTSCANKVYFEGGAPWDSPHQNACWVCEIEEHRQEDLKRSVASIRLHFKQDSAALTIGETQFV